MRMIDFAMTAHEIHLCANHCSRDGYTTYCATSGGPKGKITHFFGQRGVLGRDGVNRLRQAIRDSEGDDPQGIWFLFTSSIGGVFSEGPSTLAPISGVNSSDGIPPTFSLF